MIATQKHQQLILLEPETAKQLEELARELKTTKQALLRRAVSNLLAMHSVGFSRQIYEMRESVKEIRSRVSTVRRKFAADPEAHRACGEAGLFLTALLMELGERRRRPRGAKTNDR